MLVKGQLEIVSEIWLHLIRFLSAVCTACEINILAGVSIAVELTASYNRRRFVVSGFSAHIQTFYCQFYVPMSAARKLTTTDSPTNIQSPKGWANATV